jgi:hypothetical protein
MERAAVRRAVAAMAVAVVLSWACSRTIEEPEPLEIVEHRLEPCRKWCAPFVSLECGQYPEDRPDWTVDECVEDCAALNGVYGWSWAHQEDGTDACAQEWYAVADCVDALTCEEQHRMFTVLPTRNPDFSCREEMDARSLCFYTTPSLEREGDDE